VSAKIINIDDNLLGSWPGQHHNRQAPHRLISQSNGLIGAAVLQQ